MPEPHPDWFAGYMYSETCLKRTLAIKQTVAKVVKFIFLKCNLY